MRIEELHFTEEDGDAVSVLLGKDDMDPRYGDEIEVQGKKRRVTNVGPSSNSRPQVVRIALAGPPQFQSQVEQAGLR